MSYYRIHYHQSDIDALNAIISERDAEIERLKGVVLGLTETVVKYEYDKEDIQKLFERIWGLEEQVKDLQQELSKVRTLEEKMWLEFPCVHSRWDCEWSIFFWYFDRSEVDGWKKRWNVKK